jgi:hypothetical protein
LMSGRNAVIRLRAGVDQVEKGEKVTPFFFNQIQSKCLQSNVTCLKTEKFPGGTVSRKETMSELESHFQNEFAEPQATSFVDPINYCPTTVLPFTDEMYIDNS